MTNVIAHKAGGLSSQQGLVSKQQKTKQKPELLMPALPKMDSRGYKERDLTHGYLRLIGSLLTWSWT